MSGREGEASAERGRDAERGTGYARRALCAQFLEFFEVGAECKRLYEYEYGKKHGHCAKKIASEFLKIKE